MRACVSLLRVGEDIRDQTARLKRAMKPEEAAVIE
jgi:hypothetical protein